MDASAGTSIGRRTYAARGPGDVDARRVDAGRTPGGNGGRPAGAGAEDPVLVTVLWQSRHNLLRRRGGSDNAARDHAEGIGIRLRRQRRVYAPFTALPSLARAPFMLTDLKRRRRRPL